MDRTAVILGGVLATMACGPRRAPYACPAAPTPLDRPTAIGTAHPIIVEATSADGRWAAVCQARTDTNGDGKIEVSICGHHGEPCGDRLRMYLSYGDRAEEEIDNYAAADPTGRYVVVVRKLRLSLVDSLSGTWTPLDYRSVDEDVNPDMDFELKHRPFARFSADGTKLAYLREQYTSKVVVRDVCSGSERMIDAGSGPLLDVVFDASSRKVILKIQKPDENGKTFLAIYAPTLGSFPTPCRGPFDSWTQLADAPHAGYRVASVEGGSAVDVRREDLPPVAPAARGLELVSNTKVKGRGVMIGPLRWRD